MSIIYIFRSKFKTVRQYQSDIKLVTGNKRDEDFLVDLTRTDDIPLGFTFSSLVNPSSPVSYPMTLKVVVTHL